ncbi:MAG: hypothetical protein Q9187_004748 [Circinaria calcarea]
MIGKIVRFGPNRISINSSTTLRDIYSVNANVQRSQVYASTAHFFGGTASSNTTMDRKEHAFRRRVNVKALNPNTIKSLEDRILKNIHYFCTHLADERSVDWSEAHEMSKIIGYLVSDIMGDVTFGRSWEAMRKSDNRDLITRLPEAVAGIHLTGYMPELLNLKHDRLLFGRVIQGVDRFTSLSKSILEWRFMQGEQKDLFAALLEAKDSDTGLGFTTAQLVSEAGLFIIAGSDTTITATTATIFYLLHYPSALIRLQGEIRKTFSNEEEICIGTQLSSCQYLYACIDEAMRLTPSVGSTLMREVLPGGLIVDGEWFPSGTDIGVPHYALHHHEAYFTNPFEFIPERWLGSEPAVSNAKDISRPGVGLSQSVAELGSESERAEKSCSGSLTLEQTSAVSAFTPFGSGRTSCIGRYLAYQEMSLILARIIWLYEMRIQEGSTVGEGNQNLGPGRERKNEFQTLDRFVSMHNGPMVEFKRRV